MYMNYLTIKENINIELKKAEGGLPKSIWETYCSFSNTSGGTIYLGIEECDPNILHGIKNPSEIKKNFFNTINNKSKVSYNGISEEDFKIIEIDGKNIIEIDVKEVPFYLKPVYLNNNLYDCYKRNNEGDYKCNQNEVISMLEDSKPLSFDTMPNSRNYNIDVIDYDSLHLYRQYMNEYIPNNIYKEKDDYNFLKNLGFLVLNNRNEYVLTNCAILLFTTPAIIKNIFPLYFLDYQEKNHVSSIWNKRITTDDITFNGNLFNFFNLVLQSLTNNLPNPFILEGVVNKGDSKIYYVVREGLVNALVNCDFFLENQIKIIKDENSILFKNSGKLKISITQALQGGNSLPRNTSIMTAFRNIGVCDRGGTGIPRIFSIAKELQYETPMLMIDDINTTTILIFYFINKLQSQSNHAQNILNILTRTNDWMSITEIANILNVNRSTISIEVNELIRTKKVIDNNKQTKGKKIKINI